MDPIIATEILKGYKKPPYDDDYFIETPDKKYALYFYNVEEVTMMNYFANLAIFAENKFDSPLLSSGKVRFGYSRDRTFTYAQKSGCLIFRAPVMNKKFNPVKPEYPYLLIKPETSQFSFIDWDVTSIYYSLEEVSENVVIVKEKSPQQLDRLNYVRRTAEMIDLIALSWYDLTQFDDAVEIYINR